MGRGEIGEVRGGAEFGARFEGAGPTHLTRAPGRVNLIGEHTDYNGLPVLPMALQREITLLFRPRDDATIRIANANPEFEPRSFQIAPEIEANAPGDWGNYVKAPCQEMARAQQELSEPDTLRGFDGLVASDLPVASGLSSSSALVIAVGSTLATVNGFDIPPLEMAESMARAERYTGTQGGGMDQAITLGAASGCASRIEFEPLEMFTIPVPSSWHFVVADTLVRAEKSGAAQAAYNLRTRECREALALILDALSGAPVSPRNPSRPGGNGSPRDEVSDAPRMRYSELLEDAELRDLLSQADRVLEEPHLSRFRHVVTEATRVYEAEGAMKANDLLTFGLLMDASHESLREEYQVSSPELDRLVELARRGGAAGARLTGAGFGGCIVALADDRHVQEVIANLEEGYYRERSLPGPVENHLFEALPSAGASIRKL